MKERILILDGHPDPSADRFVHALSAAYADGARSAEHEVLTVRAADVEFSLLRTQAEYEKGEPVASVRHAQEAMDWATHVVILYPLWLGSMPALLKGLLEQMLRPGFAFSTETLGRTPAKLQGGKSARIVVTMGMPALLYQWYFLSHSLRSLRRNILRFIGFHQVRASVIGSVAQLDRPTREKWLERMRVLGRTGR